MPRPTRTTPTQDVDADLRRILLLAQAHLRLDAALLFQVVHGEQVIRAVAGEADQFGLAVGANVGIQWQPLVDGEVQLLPIEGSAPDGTRSGQAVQSASQAACVGVPLYLPEGATYGGLCCIGRDARRLDSHDRTFLALLTPMLTERLQHDAVRLRSYKRLAEVTHGKRFSIALQPVVGTTNGRLVGAEALTRFSGDIGPPDRVFAQAHAVGLGVELEIAAFQAGRALVRRLPSDTYLAINMSPAALRDPRTLEALGEVEDPARCVLELTEHVSVDGYDSLIAALAPLRDRGFRLAVDDVGAGYASFHHVLELVPDIIKIDRSLVAGVAADGARKRLITSLVLLSLDLAADVVAEGVEEHGDLATLIDLGVDSVQGYLLGRPTLDIDDVDKWRDGWDLQAGKSATPQVDRRAAFGALLRELRGEQRQADVIRAINERLAAAGETMRISQGQYSAYEHGRELPHPIRVRAIEIVLGVGPGELAKVIPREAPHKPRRPRSDRSDPDTRPSAAARLGEVRRGRGGPQRS